MAIMKPLIQRRPYKKEQLTRYLANEKPPVRSQYDNVFDAFMVKIPPKGRHMVDFIHGDVAVLLEPDTLEVVGFWVENFERKFLQAHISIQPTWEEWKKSNDEEMRGRLAISLTAEVLRITAMEMHNELERLQSELESLRTDVESEQVEDLAAVLA